MIRRLLSVATTTMIIGVIGAPQGVAYGAEPPRVSITEVRAKPDRYDGKVIEVSGVLESVHIGVFLRSTTSNDLIRLRLQAADRPEDSEVVRDSLYERLCDLAGKSELPGERAQRFQVRTIGRVQILKEEGRTATRYYPQIESPIEIKVMRVLSVSQLEETERGERGHTGDVRR